LCAESPVSGSRIRVQQIFQETDGSINDVLVPGRKMIAAGYALYGSATVIVNSFGDAPSMFMLDPNIGEFILTEAAMKIKLKSENILARKI
jgi:fructose-1,6-bisphosphatase I